jgi:hypothetical protein
MSMSPRQQENSATMEAVFSTRYIPRRNKQGQLAVSVECYMCDRYTWQRRSLFIRDKPILSSENMLHKDYGRKGSAEKNSLVMSLKGPGAKTRWLEVNRQS